MFVLIACAICRSFSFLWKVLLFFFFGNLITALKSFNLILKISWQSCLLFLISRFFCLIFCLFFIFFVEFLDSNLRNILILNCSPSAEWAQVDFRLLTVSVFGSVTCKLQDNTRQTKPRQWRSRLYKGGLRWLSPRHWKAPKCSAELLAKAETAQ